jgi:hypothetical protein
MVKKNIARGTISFSLSDISELEIQEVMEAERSGGIMIGPKTKELYLRVLDMGLGDEVIAV